VSLELIFQILRVINTVIIIMIINKTPLALGILVSN